MPSASREIAMIVMVFEFNVEPNEYEAYLQESADLRQHLAQIDGFISVERFESQATPGRFVAQSARPSPRAGAWPRQVLHALSPGDGQSVAGLHARPARQRARGQPTSA
jgi:hypothetical protein